MQYTGHLRKGAPVKFGALRCSPGPKYEPEKMTVAVNGKKSTTRDEQRRQQKHIYPFFKQ